MKWKGQNYIQNYIISKKFRKQFYFVFGWLLCWYCYKAWFEKKRTKLYSKVLLVKSLGNNFILLPVIYLFMWIMKASKNFGKISIKKIWQLISLWGVKTQFINLPWNDVFSGTTKTRFQPMIINCTKRFYWIETFGGFICICLSWLSVISSSFQCCGTRMTPQMIEFYQFRCRSNEPLKR